MANVVNPYSFVPLGTAPVRTSLDACYTGPLLTGRLDYTLTTDTPLLIPDTAKTVQDEQVEDHKRYPFFRLPDGTPTIPGSELRGAMRGKGALLITHNPEEARLLADEVIELSEEKLIE